MMYGFTKLFLETADRFPGHIAVLTDGTKAATYQELKDRAQSIAAIIPKGGLVALNIEKSADYIAALLGCWLAGAAFMPLDPALPPERRDFILDDAGPDVILTREMLKGLKPSFLNPVSLSADTLAYIIYTSGSTGKPKGVMVTHGGLVGMLQAQIEAFGLGPGSRSLFYLSTNFDASLSDIGTALLSGAALCIETGSKLDIAGNLPALAKERGITYMDIPPSLLKVLKPESMPDTLDTIVIGGEPCPPETVRAWARRFRVINVYGPTEATICTSMCVCDPETWSKPLIGNPLPGVEYSIIDGELYIGGPQLAKGYLNRPELTAQKFIIKDGKRWYRTGDLVRRNAESIEFLGRIDRQVKLRGQLVELEEIESHIMRQPGIERVAVLKRPVEGRDTLIAFLCLGEGGGMEPDTLKSLLKPVLPEWMIPAHFIVLDGMPLTTAGKVDLTALHGYSVARKEKRESKRSPETGLEKMLLSFWQRILKRENIGCDDDFFMIGGDSMAVLELALEAEAHGLPLTPALVVECPTIAGQAACLETRKSDFQSGTISAEVLRKDVTPDENWRILFEQARRRSRQKRDTKAVLFTGATGFLGSRLLNGLLQQAGTIPYVLVRAADEDKAFRRLSVPEEMKGRIVPLCGDFSLPCLGLEQAAWDRLVNEVDTIVHCGALVNMVLPYSALRPANVEGAQEIVRLACEGRRKAIHYASTLSVFVSTNQNAGTVYESDRLENIKTIYGGYGQSKWAAEYFMQQVPPEVCDIYIYRLGLITGDTETGRCASRDFLNLFVKGLTSLGSVPAGPHETLMVDVTPVDYAVLAMTQIMRSGHPGTYHIANRRGFSLADIMRAMKRQRHEIRTVAAETWLRDIGRKHLTPQESATFMALCRCLPESYFERYRHMDLFQATGIIFDTANTDQTLAGSGIEIPKADDALLDLYLRHILEAA